LNEANRPGAGTLRVALVILGTAFSIVAIFADPLGLGSSPGFSHSQAALLVVGITTIVIGVQLPRILRATQRKHFDIYTAESRVRDWKSVLLSMLSGLINGRYLAYRLFIKEVRAGYLQARLGVLWDFLEPLVVAVVFVALRNGDIINVGDLVIPYPVYVVFGTLLWQTFSDALTAPLGVIQRSKALITEVKVPPESLLLSILYRVLFDSLFRIAILFLVALALGSISWIGFLKFLLLFPSIILLGMPLGVLLAPFNVLYRDVEKFIRLALRPLMYASPVVFVPPATGVLTFFNRFNPPGIILNNLRSLATQNIFITGQAFVVVFVLFSLIAFAGWFIFHISVPILSDKI
jgi:lipopolysaccharide transport system permease protein